MQSENTILGRARHDRRRLVPSGSPLNQPNLTRFLFTFSTLAFMMSSQKEGEPTGHPRRVKPVLVTRISCGRRLLEELVLTYIYTYSDLALFR